MEELSPAEEIVGIWLNQIMMLLKGGFLSGDPINKLVYRKDAMIAYWGSNNTDGYSLRAEDKAAYNNYVIELFERVHQRKMK